MLVADREAVLAVVRHVSGQALVGHDAQAVDVAPAVGILRSGLFGAHVVRRPDGHPGPGELLRARGLGDAEVGEHALPELVEHDVVGLDVAMDDPAPGRIAEGGSGLDQHPADFARGEPAPLREDRRQRAAAQELHHEVDDPARLPDAIDGDDVGMLELRTEARLALEPLDEVGVEGEGERQHLHRHLALELKVARPVDERHAAAAQLGEDLVLGGQRLAHHVEVRDLPAGAHPHGRRRREIETAGWAETGVAGDVASATGAAHASKLPGGASASQAEARDDRTPSPCGTQISSPVAVSRIAPTAPSAPAAMRSGIPAGERSAWHTLCNTWQ